MHLIAHQQHFHILFVLPRFLLEHLPAKLDCLFAFLLRQPMTNLVSGAGSLDEGEPIAAWLVAGLRNNFDDVTIAKLRAEGCHAAVYLRADATVADLRMNGVSEVDRSCISRQ